MAKTMADMLREQAEVLGRVRVSAPPPVTVVHHPEIKPVSKVEAMRRFLDDRNYSERPTEQPIVFSQSVIRETLMKESPEEYVKATKMRGTPLQNADMGMLERRDDNPYKTYKTLSRGDMKND